MPILDFLHAHDIHVWSVDTDNPAWDRHAHVLDGTEHERASRFRTDELQNWYRRCRSALRVVLANYARLKPEDIRFVYGRFGKPYLLGHSWHFNVSNSDSRALIAVSRSKVGVDLERMKSEDSEIADLIDIVCHPEEMATLRTLSHVERQEAFYQLWVRKEAYCKAVGSGLQQPVRELQFLSLPNSEVLQVLEGPEERRMPYFVHPLSSIDDYAVAVCSPLREVTIRLFDCVPEEFDYPAPLEQMENGR